jgi:hypothetical protein
MMILMAAGLDLALNLRSASHRLVVVKGDPARLQVTTDSHDLVSHYPQC